jgi:hypothetical protein
MIFKHKIEKQNKQTTSSTCREIKKSNSNLINTYRKIKKEKNMIRGCFLFSYVLLTLWDTILHLDLSSFAYLCIGQIQI